MEEAFTSAPASPSAPAASTSAAPAPTHPARSRQRSALSCAECRRLKLKCDRVWPCSSCKKRGCAEVCPGGTLKPLGRVSKAAIEALAWQKRAEELEVIIRVSGLGDRIPPPLEFGKKSKVEEPEVVGGVEDDESLLVAGVGSLTIKDDGTTRFLGLSAGSAYFVKDDDGSDADEDEGWTDPSSPNQAASPSAHTGSNFPVGRGGSKALESVRSQLPPLDEGERLAKNYWCFEIVFWEDYFPRAYTPGDAHGSKLACVFIILALGSLFDKSAPSSYNATANHYFHLSQTALSASRFLSNNTLAAAQTLQITSNFLFNRHDLQDSGETYFPLLGMAMRMIVTMGLHRDPSKWGMTGEEADRRRLLFHELLTLDRFQSLVTGRPYMLSPEHFDTEMATNACPYQTWKWKIGLYIGKVVDEAFSVKVPSYGTIQLLDQELRDIFKASPATVRSGTLPPTAYVTRPTGAPLLPSTPGLLSTSSLKDQVRQHTLDMIFSQVFLYLHKPAFAQALLHHPDEPLQSPWAASVLTVCLEAGVYILAVAKSWIKLDPVLCSRWWHIFFHAFTASVAQSALVVTSPKSLLAQHAWGQLNIAVEIFEEASIGGAPVAMLFPRVQALRDNAFASLQAAETIPMGLGDSRPSPDAQGVVSDENLSILGPTTRLSRRPARVSHLDESREMESESPEAASAGEYAPSASAQTTASSLCDEYSPFDKLQPYAPPSHTPSYPGASYQPDYSAFTALPPTPSYSPSPSLFPPPALSPLDAFLQAQAHQQPQPRQSVPPSQSPYAPLQQQQPQLFSLPPQLSAAQLQQQQLLASLPGFGYPQMISPSAGGGGSWEFPTFGLPMQSVLQGSSIAREAGLGGAEGVEQDWKMWSDSVGSGKEYRG